MSFQSIRWKFQWLRYQMRYDLQINFYLKIKKFLKYNMEISMCLFLYDDHRHYLKGIH